MAEPSKHHSQTDPAFRDFTQTPPWLFQAFNAEFGYKLDAAALDISALCGIYFTPEHDGLKQDWSAVFKTGERASVWVNPPFSNILPWVEKAVEQQQKGVLTTLLVPHDNRTAWWPHDSASEIRDIVGHYETKVYKSGKHKGKEHQKWVSGGIEFVDAKTGKEMSFELNKPLCLIVFNPFHSGPCVYKTIRKKLLREIGDARIATLKRLKDQLPPAEHQLDLISDNIK